MKKQGERFALPVSGCRQSRQPETNFLKISDFEKILRLRASY
jgi:hypothetical protein